MERNAQSLAIACAAGGFKGVFVHGVLSAFEAAGLRAAAYAASSASVASAAFAAVGCADQVGVEYWLRARRVLDRANAGMSEVVLQCITDYAPLIRTALFGPGMPRVMVAASAVITQPAMAQTQGPGARALGRRLLVAAARGEREWARTNLALRLFDTASASPSTCLTAENFDAVAYGSTRMLHAWTIPAWVDGDAYVDASYTCACPAHELAEAGYAEVIAVASEPGPLYRDIFRSAAVADQWAARPIRIIGPAADPRELGVEYAGATEAGLVAVYRHGEEQGRAFLTRFGHGQ